MNNNINNNQNMGVNNFNQNQQYVNNNVSANGMINGNKTVNMNGIDVTNSQEKIRFGKIYGKLWIAIVIWFFIFFVISMVLRMSDNEIDSGIISFLNISVPIYFGVTGWIDVLIYVLICNNTNFGSNRNIRYFITGILIFVNILILVLIFYTKDLNTPVGNWKCKQYKWSDNTVDNEYILYLELQKNGKFIWKSIQSNESYVKGSYSYDKRISDDSSVDKYTLSLIMDESTIGSLGSNTETKYDVQIFRDKDYNEAVLLNHVTYNMYYCDRKQ